MVHALALDLGSSQIKVGLLNEDSHIMLAKHEHAPQLKGRHGVRVTNPHGYLKRATDLLKAVHAPDEVPIGISTQRSSFLLWHAKSGRTFTPLISWQDTRAHEWCAKNQNIADEVHELTGLPLSHHYVAAKLAVTFENDPDWRQLAGRHKLLFGTLETFLIWNWTHGEVHHTDLSMAARTQLVDIHTGKWSPRLLSLFGIPPEIMPVIGPEQVAIESEVRYTIRSTVADQTAAAQPVFEGEPECGFINAGTATFLMRATDETAPPGYLTALQRNKDGKSGMLWEAPVNAGARMMRGFKLPTDEYKASSDPRPGCFAIADGVGLAAPHWRADLSGALSQSCKPLDFVHRQRVYFESLMFRIRQVMEGLFGDKPPEKIVLSGGLAARFDFSHTLASFLPVPVHLLKEREMSLWGAAWLAGGRSLKPHFRLKQVHSRFQTPWLQEKYAPWQEWLASVLADPSLAIGPEFN